MYTNNARLLQEMYQDPSRPMGWKLDGSKRFVLVEQSVISGECWLSSVASPSEAMDLHLGQESAQLWRVMELVDLEALERYEPELDSEFAWVELA